MRDSDWEIINLLYKLPNITKVANLLYLTQPSLTKRLQNIEQEFHVKIFTRTRGRGIKFTAEGKFLAERAQLHVNLFLETKKLMQRYAENHHGMVNIGSAYSYQLEYLNDLLVEFSVKYPNIRCEISNEPSNILFRKTCEKEFDVSFVQGDYDGQVTKKLLGITKAYIMTKKKVKLSDLPKLPRIEYPNNDRTKELLDSWWLENFKSAPGSSLSVSYIDFAWKLVERGFGYTICFLPEKLAKTMKLNLMPLIKQDGTALTRNSWFVYSPEKEQDYAIKTFIDFIKENNEKLR